MAKNIKGLLIDAAKYPAAIEAKLPAGAPTISTMLIDTAGMIPAVPDFPMEIPALPAPPAIPEFPELPGGELGRRRYVTGAEITPIAPQAVTRREVIPSPAVGVLPEVTTRRGL